VREQNRERAAVQKEEATADAQTKEKLTTKCQKRKSDRKREREETEKAV